MAIAIAVGIHATNDYFSLVARHIQPDANFF
jgi:hypothetical protein